MRDLADVYDLIGVLSGECAAQFHEDCANHGGDGQVPCEQVQQVLVHTGQHYDDNMLRVFFKDLGVSKSDLYLGVGSGSHAEQTDRAMLAFEAVRLEQKLNLVLVMGDVNSTLTCTLVASCTSRWHT